MQDLDGMEHNVYYQRNISAMQPLSGKNAKQNECLFVAFGVPKKNKEIWLVINFRKLKKMLECIEFSVPTMKDIIQTIDSFQYTTRIEFNMHHMT